MAPSELSAATAVALSAALRAKTLSSYELTQACLATIAKDNPALNAVITVSEEQALADAARADDILARGDGGPLTGIPLLHKDIFCTRGDHHLRLEDARKFCASRCHCGHPTS